MFKAEVEFWNFSGENWTYTLSSVEGCIPIWSAHKLLSKCILCSFTFL